MAYTDQATLANNSTFISRVQVAMMTAAIQIGAESEGSDATVENKRQQLVAKVVVGGGVNTITMFVWAVVTNAVITSSSLDSDIQFQVNSVWNTLAGVMPSD